MSEKELIQNVPASLHALLAAHAGVIAAGTMPGLEPMVAPNDDALETAAGTPPEMELLRTQQQYALEDLMAGKTYNEAARTAGVNRRTLFRWVNKDPAFRAAMEAWRRRSLRCAEDRLIQATDEAAVTLTTAASHNFRAAAMLLRGRGLLPGAARAVKPLERTPLALSIPPGKRRDFEIRLRELILSFREEPVEVVAPQVALPLIEGAATSAAPRDAEVVG